MYRTLAKIDFTIDHENETEPTEKEIREGLAALLNDFIRYPERFFERISRDKQSTIKID